MSTLVQASPVLASPNGSVHLASAKMGASTRAPRNTATVVQDGSTEATHEPPSSAGALTSPVGASSKSNKSARSTPSRPSVQTAGFGGVGGKTSAGGLQPPSAAKSGKSIDVGLAKAGAGGLPGQDGGKRSAASGGEVSSTFSMGPRSSAISTPNTSLPFPPDVVPRPLTVREAQLVDHLVRLQLFLATAPSAWQQFGSVATGIDQQTSNPWPPYSSNGTATQSESLSFVSCPHPALNRFLLPNGEFVSCVYWNGLYQITGTDIVRALAFRFEAFGRPVKLAAVKKFEEGVFSDLRNLKPGEDSSLEKPKSDFLDLLFKYGCIRTQKKQKVFFWFSVPHDRLFLDALERDLKREKEGMQTTTEIIGEPARSFRWDPSMSLFEQFADITTDAALETKLLEDGGDLAAGLSGTHEDNKPVLDADGVVTSKAKPTIELPPGPDMQNQEELALAPDHLPQLPLSTGSERRNNPFTVSLFEGSPGYKQRKKKNKEKRLKGGLREGYASGDDELSASDSEGSLQLLQPSDQSYSFAGQAYAGPSVPQPGASHASMFPPQDTAPIMQMNQQQPMQTPLDPHLGDPHQSMPYGMQTQQIPQMTAWNGQTSMMPGPSQAYTPAPYSNIPFRPPYGQHPSYGSNVSISRHSQHATPALDITPDHASTSSNASQSGRMFRCPLDTCSRLFKRLEHLKRHVRTHTQERPYLCTRCPKRFSRSDNLTQHLKTHEKADRGERGITAEQSENDADFAQRLEAQVEAMAGESYHGSQFGDDASNFGSPAPMGGMRFGSVPAGQFRSSSVDPGRYSMPPPSLPTAYGGLGQNRNRTQSYPYLDGQSMSGGFGAARAPTGYQAGDAQQGGGYPFRAQTRSPMPPPSQVPQRAMSASLGGRQTSAHRYVPYPTRTPQPQGSPQFQQQAQQMPHHHHHQQQQQQQQQQQDPQHMMQPQPQYMQTPLHGYQDQGFAVPSMPSAANNYVPQVQGARSFQGSPAPTMPPRGESPAINPMALQGVQQQSATPQHSAAFTHQFSAGLGSQMTQQDAQDGAHIPIQSPATFAFDNMVASASYTTTGDPNASGWPMSGEGDGQDQQM